MSSTFKGYLIKAVATNEPLPNKFIQFKTRPSMHLAEKMELQSWLYRAENNHKQRNIEILFWNDEINDYDSGVFYRPNPKYPIIRVEDDDIIYDEMEIKFIEC